MYLPRSPKHTELQLPNMDACSFLCEMYLYSFRCVYLMFGPKFLCIFCPKSFESASMTSSGYWILTHMVTFQTQFSQNAFAVALIDDGRA